ncbi:transcriptional regulator [Candidatus Peregrinibacteria bacterium]|nr:MAG: transcriptional regulator [Candidatus Peregrinibacteria bacterium]
MPLKSLFSSQTRIKLLQTFLNHPETEYYIRELTRLLHEQINSIRRELENLKKIGLVKSRVRNRKKFFHVNKKFFLFHELQTIIQKTAANDNSMKKDLLSLGSIDLAILSGTFTEDSDSEIDLLIVGSVVSKKVEDYVKKELKKPDLRYSVLSIPDFEYRIEVADPFILKILKSKKNVTIINKIKNSLDKLCKAT